MSLSTSRPTATGTCANPACGQPFTAPRWMIEGRRKVTCSPPCAAAYHSMLMRDRHAAARGGEPVADAGRGWTEAERAEALRLIAEGTLTRAEIAARLGKTRNAVIGLAFRAGLSKPKDGAAVRPAPRPRPDLGTVRLEGCRWPVGDPRTPGFRYCDADQAHPYEPDVSPYCADHLLIAAEPRTVAAAQRRAEALLRQRATLNEPAAALRAARRGGVA